MTYAFPSTFADLKASVLDKSRLNPTSDLAKVGQYVNRAYADVAMVSKFFEGSASTSALAANATSDALPAAIIEVEDVTVTWAGNSPPMRQLTWEQLLRLRSYTTTGGGPPNAYSLRKNTNEFWPAAQGGEVLTYWGSLLPTWLSADADVPGFPEPFATTLLEAGALIQAAEFKQDLLMLGNWQQSYGQWLAKFLKFCQARMGTDARAFEVRIGMSGLLPNDPSSDWYVLSGTPWASR